MSKKNASEIVGIIFPFLPEHAHRLLKEDKTVFVKFFGKGRIPILLQNGSRLFVYESKGKKEIVGEAKIVRIESMLVSGIMSVYREKLFLKESEFQDYVGTRTDRTMLVLVLAEPKVYHAPLKLDKSVTMAGRYMTREMYIHLREESGK